MHAVARRRCCVSSCKHRVGHRETGAYDEDCFAGLEHPVGWDTREGCRSKDARGAYSPCVCAEMIKPGVAARTQAEGWRELRGYNTRV